MRNLLLFISCLPILVMAQSLSPERVTKIKSATVRLVIENVAATGTAFFISASGELLTCWHVIEPAYIRDTTGLIVYTRRVFIEFAGGEKAEVTIPPVFSSGSLYIPARSNDYCLLLPAKPLTRPFTFYKLGDFNKVTEGQEVYSCAFPAGIVLPFVSKGIFSTRFVDTSVYLNSNGTEKKIRRDAGLINIAMNRGCSGGPVIRPGNTVEEDEVIGIADVLLNPHGQGIRELSTILSKAEADEAMSPILNILKYFSSVNEQAASGIGSCLSINHFLKDVRALKK